MILGIVQTRTTSTRLPGKVLLPLAGAPSLQRQLERLSRVGGWDRLIVATSEQPSDDPVAALCDALGQDVFRGSLDNVLDRFYMAALPHRPEQVVRLTADCPLTDWRVIDRLIAFHLAGGYDYTSNALERRFPVGLDCEIATFAALTEAWREAQAPDQREHVTPFIHRQPARYRLGSLTQANDLSALRWTLDTPEDYAMIAAVYDALYPADPAFTTEDILAFLLAHPEIRERNADARGRALYQRLARKQAALSPAGRSCG